MDPEEFERAQRQTARRRRAVATALLTTAGALAGWGAINAYLCARAANHLLINVKNSSKERLADMASPQVAGWIHPSRPVESGYRYTREDYTVFAVRDGSPFQLCEREWWVLGDGLVTARVQLQAKRRGMIFLHVSPLDGWRVVRIGATYGSCH